MKKELEVFPCHPAWGWNGVLMMVVAVVMVGVLELV